MSEEKLKVKEVIVVEGRDDTNAVLRAIDGITIETHGFGISTETWVLLEKAAAEKGLIIFTDPDHAGEEIRRKLTGRFPESGQAYLSRAQAERQGDIGIENASPAAIRQAIQHAHYTQSENSEVYTVADLQTAGLLGGAGAAAMRQKLGEALGIGYGNGKAFLRKLNAFAVPREIFFAQCQKVHEEEER